MRLHLARMLVPAALVLVLGVCGVLAQDRQQQAPAYETVEDTRRALAQAQAEGESARRRAEALEVNARDAAASADRTARIRRARRTTTSSPPTSRRKSGSSPRSRAASTSSAR